MQEERRYTVHGEFCGVQDIMSRKDGKKGKASPKEQGEIEDKHLEIYGGLREEKENVLPGTYLFARPNRLRKNAETAVSCRRPGPSRKKNEVYHGRQ